MPRDHLVHRSTKFIDLQLYHHYKQQRLQVSWELPRPPPLSGLEIGLERKMVAPYTFQRGQYLLSTCFLHCILLRSVTVAVSRSHTKYRFACLGSYNRITGLLQMNDVVLLETLWQISTVSLLSDRSLIRLSCLQSSSSSSSCSFFFSASLQSLETLSLHSSFYSISTRSFFLPLFTYMSISLYTSLYKFSLFLFLIFIN